MISKRIFLGLVLAPLLSTSVMTHAMAQTKEYTIGVALASDTNPFYIAMRRGIEARAKELGVKVVFVTANEVIAQQVTGINDLVARKVDGILVSPIDAVAVAAAYQAAGEARIPVISVARHANSPHQSAYVSMDEKGVGRDIATWIGKAVGGSADVAMITGPAGAATFRNINAGLDEGFKAQPQIKIVYRKDAALTREDGLKYAEDILVARPGIKAIYCANDEVALGAVQAVTAAGKRGQIIVTGMNGIPPALQAVKNGSLGLTVELNPVSWGRLGLETMVDWLNGKRASDLVTVRHVLIDASNVANALPPAK
ncbi:MULTISPECIES: substrate-binding domain-containing protein [unclassified Beijerinckia]|uniref:substrate-binding domain-containing protein n=1 Tax=unclassified Beijerinckia TaxID=2638183 RepID=UPI00089B5111|nr:MULTISPECIES: substrate-binding domain-containing protein [unclassified Beijerinckia]MDH7796218.1 ribose transport system substrate-binding protein [Beijerinckia sp. GAS462]SEC35553.1 ribose transport system substrate-binding protein [Beijerinckia sp. 28-YEA-48]